METVASSAAAGGFIRALYGGDEHVAVVAVRGADDRSVHQRITTAGSLEAERFQRWLRHLNAQGHNIFVGMNPVRAGSRRRLKADVVRVRRLQLDLDSNGPESLRRVLADVAGGRLPPPAIVVRTSKDHYQVLWHTAGGWSPAQAEDTMTRLAHRYGGDNNVSDVARCMRLPGFRNKKPDRGDALVTWTDHGGEPVRPGQFDHLPPAAERAREPSQPGERRPQGGHHSQSEKDWAWVCGRLERGEDPVVVAGELEAARPDKHNPRDYAERTVRKAETHVRPRSAGRTR